jgi:hypothetical protein
LTLGLVFGVSCGPPATSCPNDLPMQCPSPAPSYANQVSLIFAGHCVKCHAAGQVEASRPLTSYSAVRAQPGVLTQVYACRMPPAGEPPLSATERATLLAWLVCGSPQN